MRISDWSSDVCSSDLLAGNLQRHRAEIMINPSLQRQFADEILGGEGGFHFSGVARNRRSGIDIGAVEATQRERFRNALGRSEEHTSELQSLMRISYAVFCLKKNNHKTRNITHAHRSTTDNNA